MKSISRTPFANFREETITRLFMGVMVLFLVSLSGMTAQSQSEEPIDPQPEGAQASSSDRFGAIWLGLEGNIFTSIGFFISHQREYHYFAGSIYSKMSDHLDPGETNYALLYGRATTNPNFHASFAAGPSLSTRYYSSDDLSEVVDIGPNLGLTIEGRIGVNLSILQLGFFAFSAVHADGFNSGGGISLALGGAGQLK